MAKNTPGKDITKSQEAQRKLKNTTETINKISSFAAVGIGIEYNDGISGKRSSNAKRQTLMPSAMGLLLINVEPG